MKRKKRIKKKGEWGQRGKAVNDLSTRLNGKEVALWTETPSNFYTFILSVTIYQPTSPSVLQTYAFIHLLLFLTDDELWNENDFCEYIWNSPFLWCLHFLYLQQTINLKHCISFFIFETLLLLNPMFSWVKIHEFRNFNWKSKKIK